jgi:micrococcal nuclease
MYNYKAVITRVVDGDTYDATIDLGFRTFTKQRLRLKDIDTPETWRPKTDSERKHGEECTDYVIKLIEGKTVTLTSVKTAVYGRWEAYLTLEDNSDVGTLIVENGFEKLDNYEDIDDTI